MAFCVSCLSSHHGYCSIFHCPVSDYGGAEDLAAETSQSNLAEIIMQQMAATLGEFPAGWTSNTFKLVLYCVTGERKNNSPYVPVLSPSQAFVP